jgi:hypothetical protein
MTSWSRNELVYFDAFPTNRTTTGMPCLQADWATTQFRGLPAELQLPQTGSLIWNLCAEARPASDVRQ